MFQVRRVQPDGFAMDQAPFVLDELAEVDGSKAGLGLVDVNGVAWFHLPDRDGLMVDDFLVVWFAHVVTNSRLKES